MVSSSQKLNIRNYSYTLVTHYKTDMIIRACALQLHVHNLYVVLYLNFILHMYIAIYIVTYGKA